MTPDVRVRGNGPSIWVHFPAASLYARRKSILRWRRRVKPRSEKPRRMRSTRKTRGTRGTLRTNASSRRSADPFAARPQRGSPRTSPPRLNLYSPRRVSGGRTAPRYSRRFFQAIFRSRFGAKRGSSRAEYDADSVRGDRFVPAPDSAL